jgi:hypothetical protein
MPNSTAFTRLRWGTSRVVLRDAPARDGSTILLGLRRDRPVAAAATALVP